MLGAKNARGEGNQTSSLRCEESRREADPVVYPVAANENDAHQDKHAAPAICGALR